MTNVKKWLKNECKILPSMMKMNVRKNIKYWKPPTKFESLLMFTLHRLILPPISHTHTHFVIRQLDHVPARDRTF